MRILLVVVALSVFMGCGEEFGASSGQAVITYIDPRPGSELKAGQVYTVNISFSEPPGGISVSGVSEWSLQGATLVIKTARCSRAFNPGTGRSFATSYTIQVKWNSGAKALQYVCD